MNKTFIIILLIIIIVIFKIIKNKYRDEKFAGALTQLVAKGPMDFYLTTGNEKYVYPYHSYYYTYPQMYFNMPTRVFPYYYPFYF